MANGFNVNDVGKVSKVGCGSGMDTILEKETTAAYLSSVPGAEPFVGLSGCLLSLLDENRLEQTCKRKRDEGFEK